ncbi:MAG: ABC transporter permease [Eubacteriaceae bacterium]|nr:ABC transporter permease [Eubacteriaceae bacterium]
MNKRKSLALAAALAILVVFLAFPGFFSPYGVNEINAGDRFSPPGSKHLFGTDHLGRDVFSRVLFGARYSLLCAVSAIIISFVSGLLIGLPAGYMGGFFGNSAMRLMDAINAFPGLLLALSLLAALKTGVASLVVSIAVLFIPFFTRVSRNGVVGEMPKGYVRTAQIQGVGTARLLFAHILPNLKTTLLSSFIIAFSNAMLAEASLSYLGIGIQPPMPSWGRMLSEAQPYVQNAPWCAIVPAVCIVGSVLALQAGGRILDGQLVGD